MTGLNSVRKHHNTSTMSDFTEAPRLYFDKQSVAKYNFDKLTKLETLIARISAVYSRRNAKSASSDDVGGLDTEMFLARGPQ